MHYLNGNLYNQEPIYNDFFYGQSVFETMWGLNGKVLFLGEHMERLKKSSELIGVDIKVDLYNEIDKIIKRINGNKEFMLKIQISNENFYMKIVDFKAREAECGISASFVKNYYQNEIGFIKSGNYLGNILARKELNTFEGVFTNRMGIVTEGTISNLFFLKESKIFTPSLELNILPGITRKKIIELAKKIGIEVQEGYFTKEDLFGADSVFFTNSLMKKGLLWVSEFENTKKNKVIEIHKLEKEYYKLIMNML